MTTITIEQARAIVSGCFIKAAELKLKPLSIVVLDAGGHPIAFERQNGASTGRFTITMGKASGALQLGVSSRKIAEMAAERPTFVASLAPLLPHGAIPSAGGLIVIDRDGAIAGAVGVSGDTPDNDEICALAGVVAADLSAQG